MTSRPILTMSGMSLKPVIYFDFVFFFGVPVLQMVSNSSGVLNQRSLVCLTSIF